MLVSSVTIYNINVGILIILIIKEEVVVVILVIIIIDLTESGCNGGDVQSDNSGFNSTVMCKWL